MKIFKIPAVLFMIILFCVLLAGGLVLASAVLNLPTGSVPAQGVLFQINKGESSEHVFIRLEQQNLIRSSLFLRIVSKLYNSDSSFKTGIYRIKPEHTTLDIHNLQVSGKEKMQRITIKEGWTMSRIARALEDLKLVPAADFLAACQSPSILEKYNIPGNSVEGFLFPETYYFPREIVPEIIAEKMINTFFEKLDDVFPEYVTLPKQEIYSKVIVASIVEREYRNENEAPVIASVFYNRLQARQRLESCATVAYVLTEQFGRPHAERLSLSDLGVQSPYNTYLNAGLPPGPIGNPGATALISAFSPAITNYRFFVLKDPVIGVHEFSDSYQKHLNAKELYIKQF